MGPDSPLRASAKEGLPHTAASLPVTRVVATSAGVPSYRLQACRKGHIPAGGSLLLSTILTVPLRAASLHHADSAKAYILCPEGLSRRTPFFWRFMTPTRFR